jgi:hypothetical protein
MQSWVLKSICIPGGACVSYSGSPELAANAFREFKAIYPLGTNYSATIAFFEASSAKTNNDYIVAFAQTAKLVTIREGRRRSGISKTHWIGDKEAYERFREYEYERHHINVGRAANVTLFADEMDASPASGLYSVMRNVILDRDVPSVGGFATVLSGRGIGFRFSVYSDILLNWPDELVQGQALQYEDKVDLVASGENDRFSLNQISSGYYNLNSVGFYLLKGRLLVVFFETGGGATACKAIPNVEPNQISATLDEIFSFPFHAMCLVMSARQEFSKPILRTSSDFGLGMNLYCEVNTMQKQPSAE